MKTLRHSVFWPPFLFLLLSVSYSLYDLEGFTTKATALNGFLLDRFGWLYSLSTLAFLAICLSVYFSPLAQVRIGGPEAQPLLSRWRWIAITLCTTIAVGILFWGTAEPLYHLHQPPSGLNIAPNSIDAMRFSMSTMFLHWTLIPYGIYTTAGLLFALMYYNYRRPFSLGSLLYPLLGEYTEGALGRVIDAFCLYSLVAGMAASLGAGILTIAGGLESLLGWESSGLLLGMITLAIVTVFVISAASGLLQGIRLLSDWNIKAFFLLAIFVLVTGPTLFVLKIGVEGLGDFFQHFFQKSLYVGLTPEDNWSESWTIFYWANWLAWTPVTALFLGRLALGYTVREFIQFNLFYPSLFGAMWMIIFGGTTLYLDIFAAADSPMYQILQEGGPENVIYGVFERLPLSGLMSTLFLGITFLSFVTASDSNTSAMSGLSAQGISPDSPEPSIVIKVVWGITVGAVAWTMVNFAGIDGIKMASNLGGFPILFLMILVAAALVKVMRNPQF